MIGKTGKMVLGTMVCVVFVMVVLTLGMTYIYPTYMQRTTPQACTSLTPQNAMDLITRDYMQNKLPNWGNDKDNLGTEVPSLAFIADTVKDDKGTYIIPFSAKGPDGTLKYLAHLNCTNKYIKYDTVD
ncbi:colicin M resistance protein [Serratia sp. M24T3]|uniref:colicin M resistance protein n=1 Tax=Serratia sp. M24T3 TaxID=932213 RepID=UPI00025BA2DD|nr:colicin M resistance protein [Serratia sp. M24T3]EIC85218.1 colicin M resistance protein [Serratia sp. M24T3]